MKKFIYKSYVRVVNGRSFYFVKKYETYTDTRSVPPILVSMGMHKNFLKACELANVENEETVRAMMSELDLGVIDGKVMPTRLIPRQEERKTSSIWYPQYWISKLKWAHI